MIIIKTGEYIKKFRIEKNLTQKQLGDLCGMADSAIRRYESGRANPKYETLDKIATALGISPFALLDDIEETYEIKTNLSLRTNPLTGEPEFSEEEYIDLTDRAKLIDCYDNQLNDLGKQEALKRVEELAEIKKYIE